MSARRRPLPRFMTLMLMWLLPLCSVINSGLELLVIPGNAPKIARRYDLNGENNSIYAEKDVHHIPPAHKRVRHHQTSVVTAIAPPREPEFKAPFFPESERPTPIYRRAFPHQPVTEIPVPPPEQSC